MLYHIDLTKMISGARDTLLLENKPKSVPIELLIFLLVSTIASIPQTIVSSICSVAIMLNDPKYYELILSNNVTSEAITEYSNTLMANLPDWYYAVLLMSSGFMIFAAIFYCKKFEKRKAYTIGFCKKDFFSEYLFGMLIGIIMITIPVAVCLLTDSVALTLSANVNPLTLALFLAAFVFQGMGEEALFRGYLMTTLSRRTGLWPSIIISALLFSLFHVGNASFSLIAFLNIFLFGIFAGVFMMKRGSIWAVGAIHTVWNFIQGNVFGFNVSGNPRFESVFFAEYNSRGTILSGGDFGPEGGMGVTVTLLIALLGALLLPTKKSEYVNIKKDEDIEINI